MHYSCYFFQGFHICSIKQLFTCLLLSRLNQMTFKKKVHLLMVSVFVIILPVCHVLVQTYTHTYMNMFRLKGM